MVPRFDTVKPFFRRYPRCGLITVLLALPVYVVVYAATSVLEAFLSWMQDVRLVRREVKVRRRNHLLD